MKPYKAIFSIVIIVIVLIFLYSRTLSFHSEYSQKLLGAWTINEFEHIDHIEDTIIDLTLQDEYYQIGFQNRKHLFFIKRENREHKFVSAKYEIFKQNDTIKLHIAKSDDIRLEGVYDLYIDTLSQTNMHHKLLISLYSETTFLSALRMKSKPARQIPR